MATESGGETTNRSLDHGLVTRRTEERLWRGGLIAALVFLALAIFYNGCASMRMARAQRHLFVALTQPWRFGPMGQPYWRGFGGQPYPSPPFGPWGYGPERGQPGQRPGAGQSAPQ